MVDYMNMGEITSTRNYTDQWLLTYGTRIGIRSLLGCWYLGISANPIETETFVDEKIGSAGCTIFASTNHPFQRGCSSEFIVMSTSGITNGEPLLVGQEVAMVHSADGLQERHTTMRAESSLYLRNESVFSKQGKKHASVLFFLLGAAKVKTLNGSKSNSDCSTRLVAVPASQNFSWDTLDARLKWIIHRWGLREEEERSAAVFEGETVSLRNVATDSWLVLLQQSDGTCVVTMQAASSSCISFLRLASLPATQQQTLPSSGACWRLLRAAVAPCLHLNSFTLEDLSSLRLSSLAHRTVSDIIGDWPHMSRAVREQLLLEDVLFCLGGAPGTLLDVVSINSDVTHKELPRFIVKIVEPLLPLCCRVQDIDAQEAPISISVDDTGALTTIACDIAQVSCYERTVRIFVKRHERGNSGTITQALAAALRQLLREFLLRIAQLEIYLKAGNLTLQKLRLFMQPIAASFRLLDNLVRTTVSLRGSHLLDALDTLARDLPFGSSDRQLVEALLEESAVPLCATLHTWVYTGRLDDPYADFFVRSINRKDDFFLQVGNNIENSQRLQCYSNNEQRKDIVIEAENAAYQSSFSDRTPQFELLEELVPRFLSSVRDKIFCAGRYLNVLASCNDSFFVASNYCIPIRFSVNDHTYLKVVENAYLTSSQLLVNYFRYNLDIKGHLKTICKFFLLHKSDYLLSFLDRADEELEKNKVSESHLQALLDLAVRLSSIAGDPYRSSVSVGLDPVDSLIEAASFLDNESPAVHVLTQSRLRQMRLGLSVVDGHCEAYRRLVLRYAAQWPLNLLLTHKAIQGYQLIFRLLVQFKFLERKLHYVWQDHMSTKQIQPTGDEKCRFWAVVRTREQMLHFCRNFVYYATVEVIEPHFSSLLRALDGAMTFDDMKILHERFISVILTDCLLSDRKILTALYKVLQVCTAFARHVLKFPLSSDDMYFTLSSSCNEEIDMETSCDTLKIDIAREKSNFSSQVNSGENKNMSPVCRIISGRRQRRLESAKAYLNSIVCDDAYMNLIINASQQFIDKYSHFLELLVIRSRTQPNKCMRAASLLTRLNFNYFYAYYDTLRSGSLRQEVYVS